MKRRWTARRALTVILLLTIASSLWLNGWLIFKVLDYKGRLFLAREFPEDPPHAAVTDARPIVWLAGDSRIASWPLADTPELKVVNRGTGGFTVRQTLDRWRNDLAAGNKPHFLVIQAGINDVLSAGYNRPARLLPSAVRDMPGRQGPEEIMAQCRADLKQLIESASAAGCHVIVLTVFPPGPYTLRDRFFWSAELEQEVNELNVFLRGLAPPLVTLLDAAALLSTGGRTREEYSADSLHLNAAGYSVLTKALGEKLAQLPPRGGP